MGIILAVSRVHDMKMPLTFWSGAFLVPGMNRITVRFNSCDYLQNRIMTRGNGACPCMEETSHIQLLEH